MPDYIPSAHPLIRSSAVDIVKYFYEEPVHLEALSAEADPDARRRVAPDRSLDDLLRPASYYRGYLAGSHGDRVGLTAIAAPEAFVVPLLAVLKGDWTSAAADGTVTAVSDPVGPLRDVGETAALAVSAAPVDPDALAEVARVERRYGIPSLLRLLDAGATVLFPESAHDGSDWSLFAPEPLRDRLVAAFRAHPAPAVRRFVLPYRRARSEHTFYFERWQLDALPDWIEEL